MISTFLAPYKNIMLIVLCIALISALMFGIFKFISYERNIGYQKAVAEYTARELVMQRATAAKQAQLLYKVKKAQDESTAREQKINELSTTLDATTERMRNSTAHLRREIAGLTADAARRQASAALDVSNECTDEYSALAKEAARLSSGIILLQDSWPK